MRAREFIAEYKKSREDFEGITIEMIKNGHVLMINALDDWGNNVLGSVAFNIGDNNELDPQELKVDERYQGQGIARAMYDYAKSKGYEIHRSYDQTPAGAGFWNKHRGEDVRVWEQGVAEDWKDAAATAAMFIPPLAPYAKAYNIGKNLYQVGKAVSDYKKASDELNAMEPEFAAQRERQTAQNSKFYSLNDVDRPVQSIHDDPNIEKIDELSFLGSECTKDCSGHRAGYAWSKRKGLQQANSWSPSFNKGAGLAVAGK